MNKAFRIYIIAIILYFIVWFLQLIGYAIMNGNKSNEPLPNYLHKQFAVIIIGFVVMGIWAIIYNRKDIWEGIKSFINNKN